MGKSTPPRKPRPSKKSFHSLWVSFRFSAFCQKSASTFSPKATWNIWYTAPSRTMFRAVLKEFVPVLGNPAPMTTNPAKLGFCSPFSSLAQSVGWKEKQSSTTNIFDDDFDIYHVCSADVQLLLQINLGMCNMKLYLMLETSNVCDHNFVIKLK